MRNTPIYSIWDGMKRRYRNTRSNYNITYRGKTKCLAEWAEDLGIKYYILWNRLRRKNWSTQKTFETPIG